MEVGLTAMDLLSGKEMLGRISETCQKRYGSSFNAMAVCRAMTEAEVNSEMLNAIKTVCGVRA